jgi:hypothetical protein
MNLPIYTTALYAFAILLGFVRVGVTKWKETRAKAAGIEIDEKEATERMLRQARTSQSGNIIILLVLYELLVGQTTYVAVLCLLMAFLLPIQVLSMIMMAGQPMPSKPVKKLPPGLARATYVGMIGMVPGIVVLVGTIGGVIAYYI